jgi:hypothetical protein
MRNERGITLIALVVTIVVLLILAGVTITYALGDNGIFGTAKKAEVGSIKATFSDAVSTTQAECLIKKHDPDDTVPETPAELLTMVKNYLPDTWKEKTSATTLSFTDGKLAGTISYAKDEKTTYTITVANGIVTKVE